MLRQLNAVCLFCYGRQHLHPGVASTSRDWVVKNEAGLGYARLGIIETALSKNPKRCTTQESQGQRECPPNQIKPIPLARVTAVRPRAPLTVTGRRVTLGPGPGGRARRVPSHPRTAAVNWDRLRTVSATVTGLLLRTRLRPGRDTSATRYVADCSARRRRDGHHQRLKQ